MLHWLNHAIGKATTGLIRLVSPAPQIQDTPIGGNSNGAGKAVQTVRNPKRLVVQQITQVQSHKCEPTPVQPQHGEIG